KGARLLMMRVAWGGLGLVVRFIVAALANRHLKKLCWLLFGLTTVLLALVLVRGIGMKINGARRWFNLKVMHFQPSELAKIALIIAIAHYGERFQRQMGTFQRGVFLPGAFIGLILVLILAGRDYGTTI